MAKRSALVCHCGYEFSGNEPETTVTDADLRDVQQNNPTEPHRQPSGRFWGAVVLGVIAWVPSVLIVATTSSFSGSFLLGVFILAALGWGYLFAGIGLYQCYRRPRVAQPPGSPASGVRYLALALNLAYLLTPLSLVVFGYAFRVGEGGSHGP